MGDPFLWIKALHVMAVIAWMAGLFYLPRLFVYHAKSVPGSDTSETFKVMERKLLKIIMGPAMMVAWLAGLGLVWMIGEVSRWLAVKLAAVVVLTMFHFLLGRYAAEFERDERRRSEKFFRMINEVPTILMIVAVTMVVVKPF